MEIIIRRQDGKEEVIDVSKKGIEAGIDTNIFINLFESEESLKKLKEEGCIIYTHPKCLWEMVKYVKTLNLKNKNTEEVVRNFMRRNGILLTYEEVNKDEIDFFEKRCKKAGIVCHSPDSEFILACQKPWVFDHCQNSTSDTNHLSKTSGILKFKKQGVEKVYSGSKFRPKIELLTDYTLFQEEIEDTFLTTIEEHSRIAEQIEKTTKKALTEFLK